MTSLQSNIRGQLRTYRSMQVLFETFQIRLLFKREFSQRKKNAWKYTHTHNFVKQIYTSPSTFQNFTPSKNVQKQIINKNFCRL